MRNRYFLLGTIGGIGAGAGTLAIAWAYADGGHGTYTAAKIFFPYTMYLATAIFGRITPSLFVLAFLQFPVYGFAVGLAASRVRLRGIVPAIILILHVLMVGLCFRISNPDFAWAGILGPLHF